MLSQPELRLLAIIDKAHYGSAGARLDGREIAARFHGIPVKGVTEVQERTVRRQLQRLEQRGTILKLKYANGAAGRPRLRWTRSEWV